MTYRIDVVRQYFASQNAGDANVVVGLFSDDAEVYNVNLPAMFGKDGVKAFCENLYARTSLRNFDVLAVLEGEECVLAEWKAQLTFRAGAKVGPFEITYPFDAELRGVNKFEFAVGTNLVHTLRIYHETSTVSQLAQSHAKK